MKRRYWIATFIVLIVIIILSGFSLFLVSYSTNVLCSGEQHIPQYTGYPEGTTNSYVTQTIIHQINTTTKAAYGHIGSAYSTTVNYTAQVTVSGSTYTLSNGYANMTCTYIR
ncbi:MAG: hypothetical protein ACRECH_06245 [Nitrososphaerales archaeon]